MRVCPQLYFIYSNFDQKKIEFELRQKKRIMEIDILKPGSETKILTLKDVKATATIKEIKSLIYRESKKNEDNLFVLSLIIFFNFFFA